MKNKTIIGISILIVAIIFISGCADIPEEPICGNSICEAGEDTASCVIDCPATCLQNGEQCGSGQTTSCCSDICYNQICTSTQEKYCLEHTSRGYTWFEDTNQCGACSGEGRTEGYYDTTTQELIKYSNCQSNECINQKCVKVFENAPDECTIDSECYQQPTEWYDSLCSDAQLESYIINSEKTDEELFNQLKDYCLDIGVDSHGCEISEAQSTIFIRSGYYWVDCRSICEWDSNGNPVSGYAVFNTYWQGLTPRNVFISDAGIFTLAEQCQTDLASIFKTNKLNKVYY